VVQWEQSQVAQEEERLQPAQGKQLQPALGEQLQLAQQLGQGLSEDCCWQKQVSRWVGVLLAERWYLPSSLRATINI